MDDDGHHARVKDWATSWVHHAHPGVLGHDRKRELKQQILTQLLSHKKYTHIIDHIENYKHNAEGSGSGGAPP